MNSVNWRIAFLLSVFGIVYAILTIFAVIQGYEHWVALIIIGGVGKLVFFLVPKAPIRNAFAAGFLVALFALITQALFAALYFQNNPEYAGIEIPFGLSPVVYTSMFAPFGGLLAGLLAALTAWVVLIVVKALAPNWRRLHNN